MLSAPFVTSASSDPLPPWYSKPVGRLVNVRGVTTRVSATAASALTPSCQVYHFHSILWMKGIFLVGELLQSDTTDTSDGKYPVQKGH